MPLLALHGTGAVVSVGAVLAAFFLHAPVILSHDIRQNIGDVDTMDLYQ